MNSITDLPEPTEAEIQKTAYYLWLKEGCAPGRDVEHWFEARELLRHHHGRPSGRQRRKTRSAPVAIHFPSSHEAQPAEQLVATS